jgi:Pirin C-terminal cupin domain
VIRFSRIGFGDSATATNLIQAAATRKNRPRKEFLYWSSISKVHDTSTAQYGPIVMKTDAELEQTYAELRNGTFIKQRDQ